MPEPPKPTKAVEAPPGEVVRTRSVKPKATLNLQGLLKPTPAKGQDQPLPSAEPQFNEKVTGDQLQSAWSEFAEGRKNQVAEYQILKREYTYTHPVVMVTLTNPVEETLLENFRHDLIQYLRDNLKNSELTVSAQMTEVTGRKVLYTSKEKFDHLAEKNPYLLELKERLGLDWDF